MVAEQKPLAGNIIFLGVSDLGGARGGPGRGGAATLRDPTGAPGAGEPILADPCPWCGRRLPKPLRERWFAIRDEEGLEPQGRLSETRPPVRAPSCCALVVVILPPRLECLLQILRAEEPMLRTKHSGRSLTLKALMTPCN
jgi:hypothetical protein